MDFEFRFSNLLRISSFGFESFYDRPSDPIIASMAYRYQKHYTREEARALLPQIRLWLKRILQLRGQLEKHEQRLAALTEPGRDLGFGVAEPVPHVNRPRHRANFYRRCWW